MKYKGYTLTNVKCELRDLCFSSVTAWQLKTRDVCSTTRYRLDFLYGICRLQHDNKNVRHIGIITQLWNTHKVLSQNVGLISMFWKCDNLCENVTVLFSVADLTENTNHITIVAPSFCQYARKRGWYSAAQVQRYSSACDSNPYCQTPFNYISKVEFVISVLFWLWKF
jgi:hypothetical protein